jgi:hypothetical protein
VAIPLLVLFVFASVRTASRGRRPGPTGARLRWVSVGFAVAALGIALWTVAQSMGDHRRARSATAPTSGRIVPWRHVPQPAIAALDGPLIPRQPVTRVRIAVAPDEQPRRARV